MIDLSGQIVSEVSADDLLTIRTDVGWTIVIESQMLCTTGDGARMELDGDDPVGAVEALSPVLTDRAIRSMELSTTKGLTLDFAPTTRLTASTDESFEAWKIIGPNREFIVSYPGGELVTWNITTKP